MNFQKSDTFLFCCTKSYCNCSQQDGRSLLRIWVNMFAKRCLLTSCQTDVFLWALSAAQAESACKNNKWRVNSFFQFFSSWRVKTEIFFFFFVFFTSLIVYHAHLLPPAPWCQSLWGPLLDETQPRPTQSLKEEEEEKEKNLSHQLLISGINRGRPSEQGQEDSQQNSKIWRQHRQVKAVRGFFLRFTATEFSVGAEVEQPLSVRILLRSSASLWLDSFFCFDSSKTFS